MQEIKMCFCVFDCLVVFFANERYKHINLLNIIISATLFSFESTLQYPFSLVIRWR